MPLRAWLTHGDYDAEGNRVDRYVWTDADSDDEVDWNADEISNWTVYTWDHRNRLTQVEQFVAAEIFPEKFFGPKSGTTAGASFPASRPVVVPKAGFGLKERDSRCSGNIRGLTRPFSCR